MNSSCKSSLLDSNEVIVCRVGIPRVQRTLDNLIPFHRLIILFVLSPVPAKLNCYFRSHICDCIIILFTMVDQFAYYANDEKPDRVCLSLDEDDSNVGTPGRLRLYGEPSGSDAELVGVSYNVATRWKELDKQNHRQCIDALVGIAENAGVPGIWIGETNGKFGAESEKKEIGEVQYDSGISCTPTDVDVNELSQEIRNVFDSDVKPPESGQTYTTEAIDGFQEWAQDSLGLVTIDIDILGISKAGAIHSITEIKRTGFDLKEWYPFTKGKRNDMRNYNLQIDTSHRIGAQPLLINHPKKGFLDSTDTVYLYDLDGNQMNTVRKQGTKETFTDNRFSYDRTNILCEDALSVVIGDRE